MKVGSLFAEIGFKVDSSGLEQFSNALKSFQKQISSGLKDLKEYAKAAREISNAMRDAYMPTQREAQARYRAETRRISSQARLQHERARHYKQDSATRASNAESRARQTTLKEKGLSGGRNRSASSRTVAILNKIAQFNLSGIGALIGGFFGPFGAIFGAIIENAVSMIIRSITWLGKTILSGIRFGMAYRDYRNFTGRSTSGLGGLMARTFNTTNMNPEDVLKDAARLETEYWDMMLGGGNPAIYQLLGIHPTGRGEVDMQNLLGSIGRVTGGFANRGLARSLLKQAGFSEEYLNMMLDRNPGQININKLLGDTQHWEAVNKSIREFEYRLHEVTGLIAAEFVRSNVFSTLKQMLLDLVKNLPDIAETFANLFKILKSVLDWVRETWPSLFGDSPEKIERDALDRMSKRTMENGGGPWDWFKNMILHPIDYTRAMGNSDFGVSDLFSKLMYAAVPAMGTINMANQYFVNSPEEAARTTAAVTKEVENVAKSSGQTLQGQINDSFSQTKF